MFKIIHELKNDVRQVIIQRKKLKKYIKKTKSDTQKHIYLKQAAAKAILVAKNTINWYNKEIQKFAY